MTPTPLDFLKANMECMFGIKVLSRNKSNAIDKETEALTCHRSLLKSDQEASTSEEGSRSDS